MFSTSPAEIIDWLLQYRYLLLFPITVLEGPIITVIAGWLVAIEKMDAILAYWIIIAGDMTGDVIHYFIGRSGGRRLVKQWGGKVGMTPEKLERLENHFRSHPGKTLLLGKVAHGLGGFFLVAAGVAKMDFFRFFFYNLLPTLVKSLLLLLLGYYFGHAVAQINRVMDGTALFFLVFSFLLAILYFIIPWVIKRRLRIKI